MGFWGSMSKITHGVMEGIGDLLVFAAVFIFGMVIVGEFYGVYTFKTIATQGWRSPFYYPIYIAILLLLVRLLDDMGKK